MMIRTEPKPKFSLRNLATLVIGIVGLSAATFAVAASSDASADIGSVMHRAQTEETVRGFEDLLGSLGAKPTPAETAEPAASVTPVGKIVPVTTQSKPRSQQSA